MNKPLSETHSTFWNELVETGMEAYGVDDVDTSNALCSMVQRTTIDSAEHERVAKKYDDCYDSLLDANGKIAGLNREVERLKKEIDGFVTTNGVRTHMLSYWQGYSEVAKSAKAEVERLKKELEKANSHPDAEKCYEQGLVEGERRAMKKVKEAIEKQSSLDINDDSVLYEEQRQWLIGELGLGYDADKEEKK